MKRREFVALMAARRRARESRRRRPSAFARNQGTRKPQWLKLSVFLSVLQRPTSTYSFEFPNVLERMWLFPPQPGSPVSPL
jgi:hypothetical protein